MAVIGKRQGAFRGVAVEVDIDVGQRNHAAADLALRAQRKAAEAAERQLVVSAPSQCLSQRRRIAAERSLNFQLRLPTRRAEENEFQRLARQTLFDAGTI